MDRPWLPARTTSPPRPPGPRASTPPAVSAPDARSTAVAGSCSDPGGRPRAQALGQRLGWGQALGPAPGAPQRPDSAPYAPGTLRGQGRALLPSFPETRPHPSPTHPWVSSPAPPEPSFTPFSSSSPPLRRARPTRVPMHPPWRACPALEWGCAPAPRRGGGRERGSRAPLSVCSPGARGAWTQRQERERGHGRDAHVSGTAAEEDRRYKLLSKARGPHMKVHPGL